MSEEVTIQVSEQVLRQANYIAARTQLPVEEVLSRWLDTLASELPVQVLSNEELMALTEAQLSDNEQATFSELLEQNREGELNSEGQHQLDEFMRVYEPGLLRKSQALREAVARGLLQPLPH